MAYPPTAMLFRVLEDCPQFTNLRRNDVVEFVGFFSEYGGLTATEHVLSQHEQRYRTGGLRFRAHDPECRANGSSDEAWWLGLEHVAPLTRAANDFDAAYGDW